MPSDRILSGLGQKVRVWGKKRDINEHILLQTTGLYNISDV